MTTTMMMMNKVIQSRVTSMRGSTVASLEIRTTDKVNNGSDPVLPY